MRAAGRCRRRRVGADRLANEALSYVERHAGELDGAILDVNLHGEASYAVADALLARGVPFAFATGYGADALDRAYRGYRRCDKPFSVRDVIAALS